MPDILKSGGYEMALRGHEPFLSFQDFILPSPGVYTLEGANGSGKSMFMRFLTGTLPESINQTKVPEVKIDGNTASIGSYRDAIRSGITGVFQDDEMISSMTTSEYLLLAHSTAGPTRPFEYAWTMAHTWLLSSWIESLAPVLPARVRAALEAIKPRDLEWENRNKLLEEARMLLRQHDVDEGILDEIPSRLSGGGRAAARIISAQLRPKTRVLLLDEAFNSVEANVWPKLLDTIKAWAVESNSAVLAISHNPEEIARWEPRTKFEIVDGKIIITANFEFGRQRRISHPRRNTIPIYEVSGSNDVERVRVYGSLWQGMKAVQRIVFIIETEFLGTALAQEILLNLPPGVENCIISFSNDQIRGFQGCVEAITERIDRLDGAKNSVMVVVAGHLLRSLCSFVSLTCVKANSVGVIIVPTTLSDAIDAVLSNSVRTTLESAAHKSGNFVLEAYFSPSAYVLNPESLSEQSQESLKSGVVKCLRLGLLFDKIFFMDCVSALSANFIPAAVALELFHKAIIVINDVTDLDAQSSGIGRALEFGNLHARCLLKAAPDITESESLFLGMIMDAILTRSDDVLTALVSLYVRWAFPLPSVLSDNTKWWALEAAYNELAPSGRGRIKCLRVDEVGCFAASKLRSALANTTARKDRSLPNFANEMAESATQDIPIYNIQVAIPELRAICRLS